MRPARMPSARVKVVPWHYTDRRQPTRAQDNASAILADQQAENPDQRVWAAPRVL